MQIKFIRYVTVIEGYAQSPILSTTTQWRWGNQDSETLSDLPIQEWDSKARIWT